MPILTKTQVAQFEEEGYLVFDPEIPSELLDQVVEDLAEQYDQPLNGDGVLPPCRIQDAWKCSTAAHEVAVWPRILGALKELYGRQPRPFQTLNFPTGTLQPIHSDSIHFSSIPAGLMTGVWIALEDIDEDNGPLCYYPGSHRLPEFDMHDVGVEPLEENYPAYEKFIRTVIDASGLEKRQAIIPKGQVFLWAANLVHGGDERRDLFRSRHSMVTHVYYEESLYYTPMLSQPREPYLRSPQFLPLEVPAQPRFTWDETFRMNVEV